jgi:hypothetical protein
MAVFSLRQRQRKVFSIRKRVLGTRHLRVTGKKCGYFIVTFNRSDSSLSKGEKTIDNQSEEARVGHAAFERLIFI